MVYFGRINNGRVEIDPAIRLPEGAIVRIEPINGSAECPVTPDPFDSLGAGAVDTGVTDMSREHDHYASGSPKLGPNGRPKQP
jgi:hypothetical protein